MKYTLIIGGAGFIGSNLTRAFLERNIKVIIYSEINDDNKNLEDIKDRLIIINGKLNQTEKLDSVFREYSIERVIHLVSGLIPSSNNIEFVNEYHNLVVPTFKLLELLNRYNVADFIFFSSGGTIYGNHKKNGVYIETDKLEPINYYGLSKLQLEELIKFECKNKSLNYLILRPSNPFGRFQNRFGKQGLIPVVIGKVLNNEEIDIWGDGSIIRDYIPVEILANATVELCLNGVKNEIINVGSGIGYSVNDVLRLIEKCSESSVKRNYLPNRSVDSGIVILNNDKLKSLVKFDEIDIEDSIINYFIHVREKLNE